MKEIQLEESGSERNFIQFMFENITQLLSDQQKQMDKSEWHVNNEIHNGAHFPLCVFTNNARARSKEKALLRSQKRGGWTQHDQCAKGSNGAMAGNQGKCEPAVAEANPTYFGKPG